jgi:PAS domain S-box-containing protein
MMKAVKHNSGRPAARKLLGYVVAVVGVVIAAAFRWVLGQFFEDLPPYITFYPAVVLSAILSGTAAGVLATGLSAVLVTFLLLAHPWDKYVISSSEAVGLALFTCTNLAISLLGGRFRAARWRAETEAGRAEAAARELGTWVRLLDLANVLVRDLDDRIIRWNSGCHRLYRFTAEEALGSISHELLHTRSAEPMQKIRATLLEKGHWKGELAHTAADGRELLVASEWVLWRGPDGRPAAILEANTDITRRRKAEHALRESEQRLLATFNHAALGIIEIDAEDRCVAVNDRLCQTLGYRREELLGRSVHELTAPEDRVRSRQFIAQLREGHVDRFDYEKRYLRRDGSSLWVHVTASAVRDADGRFLRTIGTIEDISERIKAERRIWELNQHLEQRNAELDAERARWQGVVEGIADEVWICNASGRMSLINTSAVTAMGVEAFKHKSADEIRKELEIFNADGTPRPPDQSPLLRSLRGEVVRGEEIMRHRRTGKVRYRQFSSAPMRDASGKITGSVAIMRDITGYKRAEQAVRESEAKFGYLYESNIIGIAYWNTDGYITDANLAFCQFLGLLPEALNSAKVTWRSLTPPEFWPHDEQILEEIRKRGFCEPCQKVFIRPDGQRVSALITAAMLAGSTSEGVAFAFDITENKRAEQALRESEQRFRGMAETIPDIIFTSRPDGWCDYVNPRYYELTGLLPVEAEGWGWDWAAQLHPDDVESAMQAWQHSIETGESFEAEYRLATADGSYRWFVARAKPVRDEQGRIVKWFGVCADVHEMKSTQEDLAAAKLAAEKAWAAAEEANQAKDYFFAVLSHELRTPLMPISWSVQLLAADQSLNLNAEQREHLARIRRSVDREGRLINDLLDVNRIIHGKLQLTLRRTAMQGMLERAVDVCRQEIEARRLHVSVDAPVEPCFVEADEPRMEQVFSNLMKNAVKFTPPDGCISIHCWQENGEVITQVADSGVGIEAEALGRIFGAFEQAGTPGARKSAGLGLGLAIVKGIVERHGGTISAASAGPDRGSTFTVRLPGAKVAVVAETAAVASGLESSSEKGA